MRGWNRIWGVPIYETGQNEASFRERSFERTHETHQTAPSCLNYGVNAQRTCSIKGHFIPSQRFGQLVVFSFHFKDLDRLVRGTGGQTSSIIVQDSIMLS